MFKYLLSASLIAVFVATGCGNFIEGTDTLRCGANDAEINWRVSPAKGESERFAIVLSGSPVMNYFSDQGKQSKRLVDELIGKGFKVFEMKYPKNGFYAA